MNKKSLSNIRRDYCDSHLSADKLLSHCNNTPENPVELFNQWQQEAIKQKLDDPTAFVLSTVDAKNMPDSRIVLLKQIEYEKFIFYTNYLSTKGKQININPNVAMNFYWPGLCQQVRVRGTIEKISRESAKQYFQSRPFDSKVAAIISKQSQPVDPEELEKIFKKNIIEWQGQALCCPESWGGYAITPVQFEFWQGRQGRMHYRLQYTLKNSKWISQTLSP